MNIFALEFSVFPHQGDGADHTVLDVFPIVHHDLVGALYTAVIHFIVCHIHHKRALFQPIPFDKRLGGKSNAVDDVTLLGYGFNI